MPGLKIKVRGNIRRDVDSTWETHIVDSTLDSSFSGIQDGFNMNIWVLNNFDPSVLFKKSDIPMSIGDSFTIDDINNGIVYVEYFHAVSTSGSAKFSMGGEAKYDLNFVINSIL